MEGLVIGSTRVIPAINSIYSQSHLFKGTLDPAIKESVSDKMENIFGIFRLKNASSSTFSPLLKVAHISVSSDARSHLMERLLMRSFANKG